jgi:hypothetical protein
LSIEDQLQRQTNINIQLRRQLEQCRKDVVEYCAQFCEDHGGTVFAKGLREIIGK